MTDNEEIDLPPSQEISNVFAAADLSSRSSSDSAKYKRAWLKVLRLLLLVDGGGMVLTDQVKSDQVLKKLANLALCSVKSQMTVDKPRTDEVD